MNTKSKGSKAERELVELFWKNNFAAIRVAGSGSMRHPSPDLLVGSGLRKLAIECKSTRLLSKYFPKKEINELLLFARLFGAEPWIGVRFDVLKWYFFNIEDLKKTKSGYAATIEIAKLKGLLFDELISL